MRVIEKIRKRLHKLTQDEIYEREYKAFIKQLRESRNKDYG